MFVIDLSIKTNKLTCQQEYGLSHYLNKKSNIEEFKNDMKLPFKIQTEIERVMMKSEKGNPRILLNKLITFFNSFEINAAKVILFDCVSMNWHKQLKTLLVILNRAYPGEFMDSELDSNFYKILEEALK